MTVRHKDPPSGAAFSDSDKCGRPLCLHSVYSDASALLVRAAAIHAATPGLGDTYRRGVAWSPCAARRAGQI